MIELTLEQFKSHLDSIFRVCDSEQEIEIQLIELSELRKTPGQEGFSLLFRGPLQQFVQQGTYQIRHELLGEFLLFIVPIREDSNGYYYEAVFNRLTST